MNTQTQEALKMAIEALEKLSYEYGRLLDGDQDYGLLPSEINADIIKTYYVKRTCQEALEQKSWQGLSDAEILDRAAQIMVERHYKEKNT